VKAQFMVVSAVIIALILISIGSVITGIQSQEFEPSDTQNHLNYIERQANVRFCNNRYPVPGVRSQRYTKPSEVH